MAETTNQEFDNSNEAGAIWIKEKERNGSTQVVLGINLNGEVFNGFKNDRKTDENEKIPDYLLVQYVDNKPVNIGAAWKGTTQNGNEKLRMKVTLDGKTEYYNAVMRTSEKTSEKSADMTIFVPTTAEQLKAAKQDAEAESTGSEKKAKPSL